MQLICKDQLLLAVWLMREMFYKPNIIFVLISNNFNFRKLFEVQFSKTFWGSLVTCHLLSVNDSWTFLYNFWLSHLPLTKTLHKKCRVTSGQGQAHCLIRQAKTFWNKKKISKGKCLLLQKWNTVPFDVNIKC